MSAAKANKVQRFGEQDLDGRHRQLLEATARLAGQVERLTALVGKLQTRLDAIEGPEGTLVTGNVRVVGRDGSNAITLHSLLDGESPTLTVYDPEDSSTLTYIGPNSLSVMYAGADAVHFGARQERDGTVLADLHVGSTAGAGGPHGHVELVAGHRGAHVWCVDGSDEGDGTWVGVPVG